MQLGASTRFSVGSLTPLRCLSVDLAKLSESNQNIDSVISFLERHGAPTERVKSARADDIFVAVDNGSLCGAACVEKDDVAFKMAIDKQRKPAEVVAFAGDMRDDAAFKLLRYVRREVFRDNSFGELYAVAKTGVRGSAQRRNKVTSTSIDALASTKLSHSNRARELRPFCAVSGIDQV